jgi:hypothetical protein
MALKVKDYPANDIEKAVAVIVNHATEEPGSISSVEGYGALVVAARIYARRQFHRFEEES